MRESAGDSLERSKWVLPIAVRRLSYETDASYTDSLMNANFFPAKLRERTLRAIKREIKTRANPKPLHQMLTNRTSSSIPLKVDVVTAHLLDCSFCALALPQRWACARCSGRRKVVQVPNLSTFACKRHRVWTGPWSPPEDHEPASREGIAAEKRWRRMFVRGQIDLPITLELGKTVADWHAQLGKASSAQAQFVAVVRIWTAVVRRLNSLLRPSRDYAVIYEELASVVIEALRPASADPWPIVDYLWTILRRVRLLATKAEELRLVWRVEESGDHWPRAQDLKDVHPDAVRELGSYFTPMRTSRASSLEESLQRHVLVRSRSNPLTAIGAKKTEEVVFACNEGHFSRAQLTHRRVSHKTRSQGCAVCCGRVALAGFNTLADLYPAIAERWNHKLNGERTPSSVAPRSAKKVWWICTRGHEFESPIGNMVRSGGKACPGCSRAYAIPGETGLDVTHPELRARWHPTMNGNLDPRAVLAGSGRLVWWVCDKGHPHRMSPSNASNGGGCGVCSGLQIISGINSLKDLRPDIAEQWHPTLNGEARPEDQAVKSAKFFWWLCPQGHEWNAQVSTRYRNGCPICSNQLIVEGVNSLADLHPEVLELWHPSRNGGMEPTAVSAGSGQKAWWLCRKGHEYDREIVQQVKFRASCPVCDNRRILPGFNDAWTRFPKLMQDWCWELNSDFDPRVNLPGSQKHWWRCGAGHEQHMNAYNRFLAGGCTSCPLSSRILGGRGKSWSAGE